MSVEKDAVVSAANKFAVQLYQTMVLSLKVTDNLAISPLNASLLLALTRHGAESVTKEELDKALNLESMDPAKTAIGYKAVLTEMQEIAGLMFGSEMITQRNMAVKSKFLTVAVNSYSMGGRQEDFAKYPELSRNNINRWAQGVSKIGNIFEEGTITHLTKIVLVNASYFNVRWQVPFDPKLTTMETFLTPTSEIDVPTMSGILQLQYGDVQSVDAKAVRMLYNATGDPELYMTILLPNERNGLSVVEKHLDKLDLNNLTPMRGFLNVHLPRTKIESTICLKEYLQKLGVQQLFNLGAKLGGITDEDIYVDSVVQKTRIRVDEEGTEVGQDTGESTITPRVTPRSVDTFKADHPFLFIVSKGNMILCIGRVAYPKNDC